MNRKTLEKIIIYILLFIGGYMSASLSGLRKEWKMAQNVKIMKIAKVT